MTRGAAPGNRPADAPGRGPAEETAETWEAPPIAVVIPAWRRAGAIAAAIASVLSQTDARALIAEVIVVDDASGDSTADAAEAVGDDPRLRVIRHDRNRGAAAARNTGWRAARSPWIAFQDSDDLWLPDKLMRQQARLAAAAPRAGHWIGAYCGLLTIDTQAEPRCAVSYEPRAEVERVEGDLLEDLLTGNFVSTQTLLVRRDALEAAGGFDEALPALEDWDLALRLAAAGPIACVDEPLAVQRLSGNSLTRSTERHVAAYAAILEKHAALFAARPRLLARHRHSLGRAARRLGRRGQARVCALEALRLDPWRPRYWRALLAPPAG